MSKKTPLVQKPISQKTVTPAKENNILIYLVFIVLIVLLYGSTVNYEFTLDDDLFYVKHKSVQKGIEGIGEIFRYGSLNQFDGTTGTQPYRPATLLFFTVQKIFFDNSPSAAHLVNVLMYILLSFVLFTLLKKLFPSWNKFILMFIILLYIAHPIHTEVVASVKSADELLAAFFGFSALLFFIPQKEKKDVSLLSFAMGTFLFFMAILSKESAIAFLLIIPLAYYMLIKNDIKIALKYFIALAIVAAVFMLMRYKAIGTAPTNIIDPMLDNILYRTKGFAEITATKSQILFYYIKLIFIPWPLSWDYSYNQIPIVTWSSLSAWAGLLIYASLLVFAIWRFRKMPILSFCIFFFFLASSPTNNLFIINGANVGERFLFVPSFAFVLFVVWIISTLFKIDLKSFSGKNKTAFVLTLSAIIISFSALSNNRSKDWINNLVLFEKGIEVCPNSSRTQYSIATEYLNAAQKTTDPAEAADFFKKAVAHFTKSISIYPKNTQAYYNAGICYAKSGDTTNAIINYLKAIQYDHTYVMPMNNLGVVFQKSNMYDSAQKYYEMAHQVNKEDLIPRKNLGDLFFFKGYEANIKGDMNKALEFYSISMGYNENNPILLNNMAYIYSFKQKLDSAIICLTKANGYDPTSLVTLENLAAVYFQLKEYTKAINFANKALAIDKNSRKALGVLMDVKNIMGK